MELICAKCRCDPTIKLTSPEFCLQVKLFELTALPMKKVKTFVSNKSASHTIHFNFFLIWAWFQKYPYEPEEGSDQTHIKILEHSMQ